MRYLIATFFAVAFFGLPWVAVTYPGPAHNLFSVIEETGDQVASVFFEHSPKTIAEIQGRYKARSIESKVRILIVPGHEPTEGGTSFDITKEREIVVLLAKELKTFLQKNSRYEVFVTRDEKGWTPEFFEYFEKNWEEIIAWQDSRKKEVRRLIELGEFERLIPLVEHTTAPTEMAMRLYGINKWSSENDMDIVIHVHLNDYVRANRLESGIHSGFAIYVPESQYYNSTTTSVLAKTILKRLSKYNPVSNLPGERGGIIEDQELIAVGSYNTSDAASMLIEYGYIYEPQFVNPETRGLAVKDLAYQTYIGLLDFFDSTSATNVARFYDTVALPHEWREKIVTKTPEGSDVFALQTALLLEGVYPPGDKSKNDCPRTGRLGPCTKRSLGDFQKRYNITGETNIVGDKTLEKLNERYGKGVF